MLILGVSAMHADARAALLSDGEAVCSIDGLGDFVSMAGAGQSTVAVINHPRPHHRF